MVSPEFMEEAHIWWDITYAGKNGNLSWEEMNIAKRVNEINAYSERILSDEEFLSVGDHPKNFWERTDDEQRKWNLTELKKKWQKEATDFIFQTKEWKANDPVQGHSTINPRGSLPTGFTFSENDLEKWLKQKSENMKMLQAAKERMRDQKRREEQLKREAYFKKTGRHYGTPV